MSILIKGMEMPTSCGKCKLFDTSHAIGLFSPLGWCRVNGKEIFRLSEKADFCPLVVVPEPHGRLIDANALFEAVFKVWGIEYDASDCNTLMSLINDAPTVITASKEVL